jgi:hypothetical protein
LCSACLLLLRILSSHIPACCLSSLLCPLSLNPETQSALLAMLQAQMKGADLCKTLWMEPISKARSRTRHHFARPFFCGVCAECAAWGWHLKVSCGCRRSKGVLGIQGRFQFTRCRQIYCRRVGERKDERFLCGYWVWGWATALKLTST